MLRTGVEVILPTDSATEGTLDKAPAMADHVIIATPPATYTQWFEDDPGFDFCAPWSSRAVLLLLWPFDKATFDGDLKVRASLITRNTDTPLTACTILNQNGLKQRLTIKSYCASLLVNLVMM